LSYAPVFGMECLPKGPADRDASLWADGL